MKEKKYHLTKFRTRNYFGKLHKVQPNCKQALQLQEEKSFLGNYNPFVQSFIDKAWLLEADCQFCQPILGPQMTPAPSIYYNVSSVVELRLMITKFAIFYLQSHESKVLNFFLITIQKDVSKLNIIDIIFQKY